MMIDAPPGGAWASRTNRAVVGLVAWTAAWCASVAVAAFGPRMLWNDDPAPTMAAIGVTVLVGIGMLMANRRYLLALDELQRAIQLQAMAWSLGAGLVAGIASSLPGRHELVAFEPGIAHLIAFMGVVYLIATLAGMRRYG